MHFAAPAKHKGAKHFEQDGPEEYYPGISFFKGRVEGNCLNNSNPLWKKNQKTSWTGLQDCLNQLIPYIKDLSTDTAQQPQPRQQHVIIILEYVIYISY